MKVSKLMLAALTVLAASCSNSAGDTPAEPQQKEMALQLYSLRSLLGEGAKYHDDCAGMLKAVGEMGYTGVETAGYKDGKFYGLTPAELKAAADEAGVKLLSSHCTRGMTDEELASGDFNESLRWWDECIAAHKEAGFTYLVCPWFKVPEDLKGLQTYCRYFNEIGRKANAAGLRFGFHNHSQEFKKVEDQVVFDYMLENTDPDAVFFQMDVYWAVIGDASPVDYFNRYPGRFPMLHIKDHREIGQSGMVGFDAIFRNADKAGLRHYVVELESATGDIEQGVKESLDYLNDAPFVLSSYSE